MSTMLNDKVAIVTGASSGLGRAIAFELVAQGAALVVSADIREDARPELEDEDLQTTCVAINSKLGDGKARYIKTDTSNESEVFACIENTVKQYGRLDIFVNNAGAYGNTCLIEDMSVELYQDGMNKNALRVFIGTKQAVKQMLKLDLDENGVRGRIVNISSIGGLVALPFSPAYCASNYAIIGPSKATAVDYAAKRIACNAVCPGYIKTAMGKFMFETAWITERTKSFTPWWDDQVACDPKQVAKSVAFLASSQSGWTTGLLCHMMGA